jgi:hypothetical protein
VQVGIPECDIYHEAGHAVMFWFCRIPILYVSIVPGFAGGRGMQTETAVSPPTTGQGELENWMRGVAAGQAAQQYCLSQEVPDDTYLISRFDEALRDIHENPDRPGHDDMRSLACLGLLRDESIDREGTGSGTGTVAWASVWLEAERWIRDKLWSAVQAVVESLKGTLNTDHHGWLGNDEVAELASAAMR